ncbi:MAG TPA: hypothetical protein VMU95_08245 [Trebonia sp.]|nr:hypothetical protein [Trebonia sp.]
MPGDGSEAESGRRRRRDPVDRDGHEHDGCDEADVEVGASATAREMTFTTQPRTHVKSRIESGRVAVDELSP